MGDWSEIELLSIGPDSLAEAALAGVRGNQHDVDAAIFALQSGKVPGVEVLRVGGTQQQVEFHNHVSLLLALSALGCRQLPVVATKPASHWLRESLKAQAAPGSWRLETE